MSKLWKVRASALRDRVLSSVSRPGWEPWVGRVGLLWDMTDDAVRAEFVRARGQAWEPAPVQGALAYHLSGGPRTAGADVGLVGMPGGFEFPEHGHGESEAYVVLSGALVFPDGRREEAGDFGVYDSTVRHCYRTEGETVLAIVLRGGLR